jgi:hypothetical protein
MRTQVSSMLGVILKLLLKQQNTKPSSGNPKSLRFGVIGDGATEVSLGK